MDKWFVVEHAEVGWLVLWHKELAAVDGSMETIVPRKGFRSFADAAHWLELKGIHLDGPHFHHWTTCTYGPTAPQFALVRDRRFGALCGPYTRDGFLPPALAYLQPGHVEEWFFTKTAALSALQRDREGVTP